MAIGRGIRRLEDDRLLRGMGNFAADVSRPGQVYARVVRATVAHAYLRGVDASAALAQPGVIAVVTASDLPDTGRIPIRSGPQGLPLDGFLQPILAADRVRYVGEPVAVVVAVDPYVAEDAAELVVVSYDELPVVLDAERALAPESTTLHADGNLAGIWEVGFGDVDAAFAAAAHVESAELTVGRHSAVPMEPRALVAEYDPVAGELEIWGIAKIPQFTRRLLARMLSMPESRIRVRVVDVGGGFGVRGEFYQEDFLVPWLAQRLCRPVKWVEDRAEHLVSVNHSRQQSHRLALAFDSDGLILALRAEVFHDNGAYVRSHGLLVPELTVTMLPGPYRIPAYQGVVRCVLTNKTPCGTYRAPGRYEGTFVREQVLDVAAGRLGIDPVELRRRNLLTAAELPHSRPLRAVGTDMVLDAGDYPAILDAVTDRVAADGWSGELSRLRAQGRHAGVGYAMFLEKSGIGPAETADVIVDTSGRVRVHAGGSALGQGVETIMAQIVAEELGVTPATISVINGDPDLAPDGLGSWASRTTVVAGSAVHLAARAVADKARGVAAVLLGCEPAGLHFEGGSVVVKDDPGRSVSLGEVAAACRPGSAELAAWEEPGLACRRTFEVGRMTYPYGAHAALVEVDPETGGVLVRRYLVAQEVGRAINPVLVRGQLVGGAAQGIGGALLEEFRYDEAGKPLSTTLYDYRLPTATEVPRVDTIITEDAPSAGNPLRTKGAGEGGTTAAGASVANAVRDALGLTGHVGRLPLTAAWVAALADRADAGRTRRDHPDPVALAEPVGRG